MDRVLVTGASGFIGRQCLPLLAARVHEVHAISSKRGDTPGGGVRWHQADLLDPGSIGRIVSLVRPTHLMHLAWHVSGDWDKAGGGENLRFVQASLELLREFAESGGVRAVFAGSCTEYDWSRGLCSERLTPRKPSSLYGACKSALGDILEAFSADTGLSSAWARIFFVYGPHEPPARLVSSVARSLIRGEPALCSHGEQARDFLYVADVADALVALIEGPVSGPVNIGSGRAVAVKDVAYRLADRFGRRDLIRLGAIAPVGPEHPLVVADTTRLEKEVGWQPAWDLDRGLDETVAWLKGTLGGPGAGALGPQ